ncbi:MAG TPA: DUF2130 domain-containing protein [Patescibacteria group bacterium]|nr:DUF2130 domain-containing protein [Patescibacteria group bacterium]
MNDIKCPHCGKLVHVDEVLRHQLEKTILKEESEKQKEELDKARLAAEKEAAEKFAKEKHALENKLLKEQDERERFEKKISEEAARKAAEEQRLKIREKDLQLDEIRRVNEDLKRKLEQGSQQRQGETLELDLEEQLRAKFTNDEFVPIPKGVEGADIWQKVRFNGKVVGSILWETKRTKAWSNGWITKLKDDAAKVSASESIIVSQVLPEGSTSFDRKDGVWITTYEHAIGICRNVRFLITTVASVKSSTSQTDEDWGQIRDYMLSDSFKHRMQAHFDGVKALRDSLDAEKRATLLRWKKQESQIEKLDTNTTNFYGELKAIVSNLPEIKGVDAPLLEDGNEEDQGTLV